ncbi:VOC family protein [bacterium]|nr:MAG: VOC family protein [bacterium]MCL4231188.1 VOC family protein [Dehalococcoidia bacterium]
MSNAAAGLAPCFFQVAYVVRDLAAAEEWFQRVFGVRSFFRLQDVTVGAGCTFRGAPADFAMNLALGYMGDTQIELIEPVRGISPYSEFLASRGPGLHHIAFAVPDFPAAVASLKDEGLPVLAEGYFETGTHFAYFECEQAGASVVEILGFNEATRAFMESLRQSSR